MGFDITISAESFIKQLGPIGSVVWVIAGLVWIALTTYAVWRMGEEGSNSVTATTDSPGATVQQVGSAGGAVTQVGSDVVTGDKVDGDKITNNYIGWPSEPSYDVVLTQEKLSRKAADGRDAEVDVYVLWREVSWKPNRAEWNSDKRVREFLASSRLNNALASEHVIACVGLVSNEMKVETRDATPDTKEDKLGDLSDERAEKLCHLIAEETKAISMVPKFVGIGLGYNMHPGDREEDQKQRALVLLGIKATTGKPFEKDQVDSIIAEVSRTDLRDFKPSQYSRVVEARPVCWMSIERGVYDPPCETH